MNKKAHHELGFTPYLLLVAGFGLIALLTKRMYSKAKNYYKKKHKN